MIRAKFYMHDKTYFGFAITGHAEYAEPGEDILCSAVSALAINTVNSIEDLTEDHMVAETKDGFLRMKIRGQVSDAANTLLKSLRVGLCKIYEEYGDEYIRIFFKEVS